MLKTQSLSVALCGNVHNVAAIRFPQVRHHHDPIKTEPTVSSYEREVDVQNVDFRTREPTEWAIEVHHWQEEGLCASASTNTKFIQAPGSRDFRNVCFGAKVAT